VYPISKTAAGKIDFIEEGDLLISMRGPSSIAILRPSDNKIIWATRGSWRHQHHATMSDEGLVYLYDNEGGSKLTSKDKIEARARLIEYDITRNSSKILYDSSNYAGNMHSYWRGYYKKLQDDSLIFTSSETGRILQVSENEETIWELRTIDDLTKSRVPYTKKISSVMYYDKNYPTFLKK
jgi:hypothetical protein